MQFRTEIETPAQYPHIGYADRILTMGSCFSENIGGWLDQLFFDVTVNPFGVLYNPESIAHALELLLQEKHYTEHDVFCHQGLYHTFDHHSRFSDTDAQHFTESINRKREEASQVLLSASHLMITFGTAWVYELKESGQIVSNCHKLPEARFTRRRLTVEEITARWTKLIEKLREVNPQLQIHFTVSPIRHLKDTLHGNQLSKSTLLLAIDQLQQLPSIYYFPAYEMLIDDLRDYRFYASDLTHPSEMAIEYIRDKFRQCYFTQETEKLSQICAKMRKALEHRPNNPDSDAYRLFLQQNIEKANQLINKNPFFALQKIVLAFQQRIKTLS